MLEWHSATSEHRTALSTFRCADPANSTFDEERGWEAHDAPWEFEVQEHLNALNPPLSPPSFLLVGFDELGLAATIELHVSRLDRLCFVAAVGVAHRASGQGLGGEAVDQVHRVMVKYGFLSDYWLAARIDPDNSAAQSVFESRGFTVTGTNGRYENWATHVS